MICIKTKIPDEICKIDDELKAIYHSHDSICIWVFKTRNDRNKFMDETKLFQIVLYEIFFNDYLWYHIFFL